MHAQALPARTATASQLTEKEDGLTSQSMEQSSPQLSFQPYAGSDDLPGFLLPAIDEGLSFTVVNDDRQVTLQVSGPSGPREACCGHVFTTDILSSRSRSSTGQSSVNELARSIQGTSPPSRDQVVHKLTYIAGRMQSSELAMDLSQLQLKIALATYMDCVRSYELERTVTHKAIHEASLSQEGLSLWRQSLHTMRKGAMRRLPDVVEKLGPDFALLAPYGEELGAVRNTRELAQLEARINGMFQPAD
ncbi:hypothetical protein BKA70DRAFT_1241560 [Coprinopsis sp. MPI-PUGE-AT-0042]|nr:hypothetical protein BKA70DRAFT_1241560 [Coprinopsis sp. MPI-PUGE-AT-0042]